MNQFVRQLFIALPVFYPFMIYLGLKYLSPGVVGTVIAGLIGIRLILQKNLPNLSFLRPLLPLGILVILLFAGNYFLNLEILVRFYPVIMNSGFFLLFALSLIRPPSMIENFARMTDPDLSDKGIDYTRKVTVVWTIFLLINLVISLYTTLYCSLETWTLYNGFIAYVLMGLLFSIEYIYRLKVLKKNQ